MEPFLSFAAASRSLARWPLRVPNIPSLPSWQAYSKICSVLLTSGTITVRAGLDATVEVSLPRLTDVRQEITVTAPAFVAPEEVKTSAFLIQPTEILRSAGALQDVSRYVQSLPGVAIGTNDFRNDLIVRGEIGRAHV